ncbi:hypothetical protein F4775DRAFT_542847 [Biscogniauxia sp. FL1348]|nr:hypothetical protein F4775DRAFT_542847 [Biscogniauxia sp. FL1348]
MLATRYLGDKYKMTGRNGPRSKNGCSTCRIRKVKCDEQRPTCGGCRRMQFACDWVRLDDVARRRTRGKPRHQKETCSLTKLRPLKPAAHDLTPEGSRHSPGDSDTSSDSHLSAAAQNRLLLSCTRLIPPPSPPNIPCSNSVLPARHDQVFLEYFPASTVYYLYASRRWGPLQYLCEVTALSSSMVMRMILAISASEMQRRGLCAALQGSRQDLGLYHYTAALKELQDCVAVREVRRGRGIDEIVATVFLMIQYGLQSTSLLSHVKAHFSGIRSLVTSYVWSLSQPGKKQRGKATVSLPPLSSRLLLWILYTDATSTWDESYNGLMKLFSNPSGSSLSLTQLYRDARVGFPSLWGDQYPVDCHMDDVESLKPFDLVHRLHMMRCKIWKAKARTDECPEAKPDVYDSLMGELKLLQESYEKIFGQQHPNAGSREFSGHIIKTAAKLSASYWACVLFCRRWLCPSRPAETIHHQAIARIVDCLYDQYAQEKRRLVRFVWPIFMAAIETKDTAQRSWLLERLYENRHAFAGCEWSWGVTQKIVETEGREDQDCVDLSYFV